MDKTLNRVIYRILPWIIPVGIVLIWFATTRANNSYSLFPTPEQVWTATARLIREGTLFDNVLISAQRAFGGLAAGGLVGFLLGVLCGQFRIAEGLLNTPIQMIRNVPYLALMPLILIWFGIGETSKLVMISLGTFFPIYLNTFHGIRYVDKGLQEMGIIYGFSPIARFTEIIFPGAMTSIMSGIRLSFGRMWLTLIVAETVAARSGIGYMATNARELMMMDVIVLSLIIYAILGSLSDMAVQQAEKRVLRWHPNYLKG